MNRSPAWLKSLAWCILLAAVGAGRAPAAPLRALYVDNNTLFQVGKHALTGLNFNVTTVSSASLLTDTLLASVNWDVVVIEQYGGTILVDAATTLKEYVQDGGAVILNYWDMDGDAGGSSLTSAPILRDTFGVQAALTFSDPQNVNKWLHYHSIFHTPHKVIGLSTSSVPVWLDKGDRMEPGPSYFAKGLAGFTPAPPAFQEAAIIEANYGRTLCNGFLFDNMNVSNSIKLLQNEIWYVARPPTPNVYPSQGEYTDRIRVNWTCRNATLYEVFMSTNPASPFVKLAELPGAAQYYDHTPVLPNIRYYYTVRASNDFGTRGFSYAQTGWRRSAENHAVGDYDGDRKADPAVYEPATGRWAVRLSGNGYGLLRTTLNGLGPPGAMAVTADYDGDRRADPAVYHAPTATWRLLLSGAGYAAFASTLDNLGDWYFYSGQGADIDGDRFADPLVYLELAGLWRFAMSGSSYLIYESMFRFLGGQGWSQAWADYDGDGTADPCVYNENTGTWKLMLSARGYAPMSTTLGGLGGLRFIPVPADYDGDRLADPAVCNPDSGEWRVLLSGSGYARVTADLPF